MTVGELIEQLQALDPDLTVLVKQGKVYNEARKVNPGTWDEEEGGFEPDEDEEGANDAVHIGT